MTPETPGFPAVWLRHNCPCPDCRDPVTGQRLLKITDIPNGLVATVTAQDDTEIVVTFLALLELIRLKQLRCVQEEPFAEIELRRV